MKKITLSIIIIIFSLAFTVYGEENSGSGDSDGLKSCPDTVVIPEANFSVSAVKSVITVTVTLSCGTDGSEIWYTLDGTIPIKDGIGSFKFSADPIILTADTTIKAIAVMDGMDDSAVFTVSYTIPKRDPKIKNDSQQDKKRDSGIPTIIFIPF